MAHYVLTEADKAKLTAWTKKLRRKRPNPLAYLDFAFSHASGIGLSVTATDALTGKTFDLSDYDSW